jgi:hypothetical protein
MAEVDPAPRAERTALPHLRRQHATPLRARIVAATTRPTLDDLAAAARAGWGADTAWTDDWDPERPERGQCGSTALVVQDHRGGTLVRALVDPCDGSWDGVVPVVHYWTVADVGQVDLTWHQFPATARILSAEPVGRDELLGGEWFVRRYRTLAQRVEVALHTDRGDTDPGDTDPGG